jgi:hypothetical protein
MGVRKILRKAFHCDYIVLNQILMDEQIVFNWKPIFEAAGHLSNKQQRELGQLIVEYIHGNTVSVYNEYAFMKKAVECYESIELMEPPLEKQWKFEELMRT